MKWLRMVFCLGINKYKSRILVSLGVLMMKHHGFKLSKYLFGCTERKKLFSFLGLNFAGLLSQIYKVGSFPE